MKITVCVKEVMDPDAVNNYAVAGRLEIGVDGKTLTQTAIPRLMNGYDEQAIEAALQLRDAGADFTLTVVSAGPEPDKMLKHAAALGAQEIVSIPGDPGELDYHAVATLQNISAARANGDATPFFVAVGFHKPHLPFVFPEKYLELYPEDAIRLPENPYAPYRMPRVAWQSYGETRGYSDIAALHATGAPNTTLPDDVVKYLRRAYYAATSYADYNVGRVLAAVEAAQLDPIIVLFGDHGPSSFCTFRRTKALHFHRVLILALFAISKFHEWWQGGSSESTASGTSTRTLIWRLTRLL